MSGNMKAANGRTGPWAGLVARKGFSVVEPMGCSVRKPNSKRTPLGSGHSGEGELC